MNHVGEILPAFVLGTLIDSIQQLCKLLLLLVRQGLQQPVVIGAFNVGLGVLKPVGLVRSIEQLTPAVLGIFLTNQEALGLQAGNLTR